MGRAPFAAYELTGQFETAWKLAQHHLHGLTTDECLWRAASTGPHVTRGRDSVWRADWPEQEGYDLGPPSIAWITWHIGFWWSMAIDHSFGKGKLTREQVTWPGDAGEVREWLYGLAHQWRAHVAKLGEEDWRSTDRTHWPFTGRPFAAVVAWANLELMKNASEIGYARFLHAARDR